MTPELWVAVAIATIGALPAIGALILGVANHGALGHVTYLINSRVTELLSANSRADRAEGLALGGADAAAIQAMITAAMKVALATPPPTESLSGPAAVAAALITGEARAVAGELKGTAADAAAHLARGSAPGEQI